VKNPYNKDTFASTGFAIVTKETTNHKDWGVGFSSVTEGEASEVYYTT
jgi:hypothetical protein